MAHRDFIAIGTSSGGVDTLRTLVSRLPRDLQATIAIDLHVGAHDRSGWRPRPGASAVKRACNPHKRAGSTSVGPPRLRGTIENV